MINLESIVRMAARWERETARKPRLVWVRRDAWPELKAQLKNATPYPSDEPLPLHAVAMLDGIEVRLADYLPCKWLFDDELSDARTELDAMGSK